MAGENHLQDLPLARRESRDTFGRGLPAGQQLMDHFIPRAQQSVFPGEHIPKPDACQLIFADHVRPAPHVSGCAARLQCVSTCHQMCEGHATHLFSLPEDQHGKNWQQFRQIALIWINICLVSDMAITAVSNTRHCCIANLISQVTLAQLTVASLAPRIL